MQLKDEACVCIDEPELIQQKFIQYSRARFSPVPGGLNSNETLQLHRVVLEEDNGCVIFRKCTDLFMYGYKLAKKTKPKHPELKDAKIRNILALIQSDHEQTHSTNQYPA